METIKRALVAKSIVATVKAIKTDPSMNLEKL